jgi:hypothetical protein
MGSIGHCDIAGNEMADKLASGGSTTIECGPATFRIHYSANDETMGRKCSSEILLEFSIKLSSFTVDILLFFSPETGESAQLRFALKNFGRIFSDLGEFRPFCSRRICCFGEISPKSKEIHPKFWGRNLTARIRPIRARKIITVFKAVASWPTIWRDTISTETE